MMHHNRYLAIGLLIIVLGVGVWFGLRQSPPANTASSNTTSNTNLNIDTSPGAFPFDFAGQLSDVSGGSATGIVQATYLEGAYVLLATAQSLPDPEGKSFYEGWVVRTSPLDMVSMGHALKTDDGYTNSFSNNTDLTDHTSYVLTLEQDDGNPDPGKHVLEGTLHHL